MISSLRGNVSYLALNTATIDVAGVGYEVIITRALHERLNPEQAASVVVYTDVKEDSLKLYGFADALEKQVFMLLIQVQGIGARTASELLSKIDKTELLRFIAQGDLQRLQQVKGIGKKTAERIVLELKDKVADHVRQNQAERLGVEKELVDHYHEATEALVALGFARRDAELAIKQVQLKSDHKQSDAGDVVREALRFV